MSLRKIGKVIIFLVYTYIIANSLLFATGIAFFEKLSPKYCWKFFSLMFCQSAILEPFFEIPWELPDIIHPIPFIFMEIAVFFYPVRLWWRKRTVFHAWLVAVAGACMPQYLLLYLSRDLKYLLSGMIVMTAGYAIAWLIIRRWRGKCQALREEQTVKSQKG